jgi:hypothetical protein
MGIDGIDGIGGPKGPAGPSGPGAISPTEPKVAVDETAPTFSVAEAQAAWPVDSKVTDTSVVDAIQGVAEAYRAGDIESPEAAFEAAIEQIVETRYATMEPRDRQRFAAQLKQILEHDPGVGAQIKSLLGIETDP